MYYKIQEKLKSSRQKTAGNPVFLKYDFPPLFYQVRNSLN